MNKLILSICIISTLVVFIDGHARLWSPRSRSEAWRDNSSFPVSVYSSEWCGFVDENIPLSALSTKNIEFVHHNKIRLRNVKCGLCGPIYKNDPKAWISEFNKDDQVYYDFTSYEYGSDLYRGWTVQNYKKGETIDVTIQSNAVHDGGPMTFRICSADDYTSSDPPEDCFEQNILSYDDGKTEKDLLDGEKSNIKNSGHYADERLQDKLKLFTFRVKLPENLTCKHCVLQWLWVAGSHQVYKGCSDISIQ